MGKCNEKTCGECYYWEIDEITTPDDYFVFEYCEIGQGPDAGITRDTPACDSFRPLRLVAAAGEGGVKHARL